MSKLRVDGALALLVCYDVEGVVDFLHGEGLSLKRYLGFVFEELLCNCSQIAQLFVESCDPRLGLSGYSREGTKQEFLCYS